jgi:mono/diheme cytochrome c family protein
MWLFVLLACGSQRRGEPIVGPLSLTPEEERGRAVYMVHCQGCHPGGEAGLGPTLTKSPAAVWMQRQQIRLGAGQMPAFGRDEIPKDDLDALCAFLKTLKHPDQRASR